ncbi:hypothetical protein Efla_004501 [Eimeria flavescens]
MDDTASVGSPELLPLGDGGAQEASSFLPGFSGLVGPLGDPLASTEFAADASRTEEAPGKFSSFSTAPFPPRHGALSCSEWTGPPSQSSVGLSQLTSQGGLPSQLSLVLASPPTPQGTLPIVSGPPPFVGGLPPRDPTPADVGKGIFLCERVVLEYSGDSQLPAEVRLALKHPHGYKLKGLQRSGGSGAQSSEVRGASSLLRRNSCGFEHEAAGTGQGDPADPSNEGASTGGGPCICSECGRCTALAEARSMLSPFGIHLRLGVVGPPEGRPPGRLSACRPSTGRSRAQGKGAQSSQLRAGSPVTLALACLPSEQGSSPSLEGAPSSSSKGCICSLLPAEGGGGAPAEEGIGCRVAGELVCDALSPQAKASVEAAAALKRALTYFLLEAPPPAAAALVKVGAPLRASQQTDPQGALQQQLNGPGGPLAAVKVLTQQQQERQQNKNKRPSSSSSSSSSGRESQALWWEDGRARDSQGALLAGLLDAIMQLHDVASQQHQAAVCSNHFAGLLANHRVVVTAASKAFQSYLLQHEEAVKAEFPRGTTAARRQQQEARRRRALSTRGPLEAPPPDGGRPPVQVDEGKIINEALQMGPSFSLQCFIFEGQHRARSFLKLLKAFVSIYAHDGGAPQGSSGGPSTYNSFVAAAAARSSAEAKAFKRMGKGLLEAPLQVYLLLANFRVRGARVTDGRVSFTDMAVSYREGLPVTTKRLRIRGLLLPQSQKEILNAVHALEVSGALSSCSISWGFSRQPHVGAPFYSQSLSSCFPGERLWRQFQQQGGALQAQRAPAFNVLRALVPDLCWGLAKTKQREAQQLQAERAAAREAAAAAVAAAAAGRPQQQPLLALTDAATTNGYATPADASSFYCWLAELREQLPAPLRRRCMSERKALQVLNAAKEGACQRGGGLGAPEAPLGPPLASVAAEEAGSSSAASMRLCVPFVSHRFAAGRKEQTQLLLHAPAEALVSSVYFRFLAKHEAPPPLDADLGPPLRPAWLRALGALKVKRTGLSPPQYEEAAVAAAAAEAGGPPTVAHRDELLVCLIPWEAVEASVFGKDGLTASVASVVRLALEETATSHLRVTCLSAANVLAAVRRHCNAQRDDTGRLGASSSLAFSLSGPLKVFGLVLTDPVKSQAADSEMKSLLQLQREAAKSRQIELHFVTPKWAYHFNHEGSLDSAASRREHLQIEGLQPCCSQQDLKETATATIAAAAAAAAAGAAAGKEGLMLLPVAGPRSPERLTFTEEHQKIFENSSWGLPLFGWCLLCDEADLACLSISRDALETVWGVSLVVLSSLSPSAVLRGLHSFLSSKGLEASAAPADMRYLPVCVAAIIAEDNADPRAAAEALGICSGGPSSPLSLPPTRDAPKGPPLSPRKCMQPAGNRTPSTPLKGGSRGPLLSPRQSPSPSLRRAGLAASKAAAGASHGSQHPASPVSLCKRGGLSLMGTREDGGAPVSTPKKKPAASSPLNTWALGIASTRPRSARLTGAPSTASGHSLTEDARPRAYISPLGAPFSSSPFRRPPASSPLRVPGRLSVRGLEAAPGCRANLALHQRGPWGSAAWWGARGGAPQFCVKSSCYKLSLGRLKVFLPGFEGIPLIRSAWLIECLRTRRLLPIRQFLWHAPQQQQQLQQVQQQQLQQQREHQQQQEEPAFPLSGGPLSAGLLTARCKHAAETEEERTPKKRRQEEASSASSSGRLTPHRIVRAPPSAEGAAAPPRLPVAANGGATTSPSRLHGAASRATAAAQAAAAAETAARAAAAAASAAVSKQQEEHAGDAAAKRTPHGAASPSLIPRSSRVTSVKQKKSLSFPLLKQPSLSPRSQGSNAPTATQQKQGEGTQRQQRCGAGRGSATRKEAAPRTARKKAKP